MVEFYLLTFPRFPLRKKEHKSYFGKNRTHDFRTSRCAAYLLDHSGDERLAYFFLDEMASSKLNLCGGYIYIFREYGHLGLVEAKHMCAIHGLARYSFVCFRSKRVDRCVWC